MIIKTNELMTKTEIKEDAQRRLLNDGAGAFLHLTEDVIDSLERQAKMYGQAFAEEHKMELRNAKTVIAEMDRQFERMKKFFLFEGFQSSH
jgi:hypothetical protein